MYIKSSFNISILIY